MFTDVLVIKMQ